MDDPQLPTQNPPQWLVDLLQESEAEADAGLSSPWPVVRERMMKLIEDLRSGAAQRRA